MPESILGEIPVTVRLRIGSESLKLYVTSRRIIVAHGLKKGRGALAVSSLLGKYGGSPDEPFKKSGGVTRKGRAEVLSIEKILGSKRDNFALGYDELVSVELQEGSGVTEMVLLTRDDKFQFSTRLRLDEVVGLLGSYLGDRLTARKLRA